MNRWIYAMLVAAMLSSSSVANAASISGIVVFTTDDFGNPNGHLTYDAEVEAHLWRTLIGPKWYGLFVWAGLPNESLATQPLNAPNLMVETPLVEGENDFTIVGEPGPLTTGDDYDRFSLNLYFDGVLDHPGLSVLFPRHGSPNGDVPTVSRANFLVSMGIDKVFNVPPSAFYDDGLVRVSVQAVSFFQSDIDIVSPLTLVKSGTEDYIGVLKVFVEPSQGGAPVAPLGGAPGGFGIQPGGGTGAVPQAGGPIGAPVGFGRNPAIVDPGVPVPNQAARGSARPTQAIATGDAQTEPTVEATVNGTTTPPAGTVTPSVAARGTTTATRATQQATSTPAGTPGAATATPHAAGTGSPTAAKPGVTPTPQSGTVEKRQ